MIDKNLETLVANTIVTQADRVSLLESLALLLDVAFIKGAHKTTEKLKKSVAEKFFPFFEALLQQTDEPLALSKLISELEKYIVKLPAAKVTISYEPTRAQFEQLATRIRATIAPQAVIEYQVVTDFILGIQIDFNGKSYKKSLEDTLL